MKKLFACIVFMGLASIATLFAQRQITVPLDDSKEAVVCVNYEGVYNGKTPQGYIVVNDAVNNKELVKVDVNTFSDDEYLSTVGNRLSLDEQVWVLYDDFNFDGIKDVALINGELNYDDSYQYQVYLGTKDGKLVFNPDFTDVISQGGIMTLDADKKELLFEYEDDETGNPIIDVYTVKSNKPVLISDKQDL